MDEPANGSNHLNGVAETTPPWRQHLFSSFALHLNTLLNYINIIMKQDNNTI